MRPYATSGCGLERLAWREIHLSVSGSQESVLQRALERRESESGPDASCGDAAEVSRASCAPSTRGAPVKIKNTTSKNAETLLVLLGKNTKLLGKIPVGNTRSTCARWTRSGTGACPRRTRPLAMQLACCRLTAHTSAYVSIRHEAVGYAARVPQTDSARGVKDEDHAFERMRP